MSDIELKPCPFCGSTDLDYGIYLGTLWGFDYVECQNCGGKINAIHKPKLICANELWNKRADEKHGVWIGYTKVGCYKHLDKNGNPIDRDCKYYECNKCRHRLVYKSNYCPNCGAKMEADE